MLVTAEGTTWQKVDTYCTEVFCRQKADCNMVIAVRVVQVVKPSTMQHAFSSSEISEAILRDRAAACNNGMHNGGYSSKVAKRC